MVNVCVTLTTAISSGRFAIDDESEEGLTISGIPSSILCRFGTDIGTVRQSGRVLSALALMSDDEDVIRAYRTTTPDVFERISLFSLYGEWHYPHQRSSQVDAVSKGEWDIPNRKTP